MRSRNAAAVSLIDSEDYAAIQATVATVVATAVAIKAFEELESYWFYYSYWGLLGHRGLLPWLLYASSVQLLVRQYYIGICVPCVWYYSGFGLAALCSNTARLQILVTVG